MTNTNRVRRGMASNPERNMCPGLPEYTDHIFHTCERAREVWHYFEQANTGVHDPLELKEWVLCNLTHMTTDTMWPMKFTFALWWLWRWRNEACLGRISNIPGDKIRFLFMSFKEISNAWLSPQKWHIWVEGAQEETWWVGNHHRSAASH